MHIELSLGFLDMVLAGALVCVMLGLHAYVLVAEECLIRVRYAFYQDAQWDALFKDRASAYVLKRLDRLSRTIRVAMTASAVGLGLGLLPFMAVGLPACGLLGSFLGVFGAWSVAVCVHAFASEIIPNAFSSVDPSYWLRKMAPGLRLLERIFRPLVFILELLGKITARFAGWKGLPPREVDALDTAVQIRALGGQKALRSEFLHELFERACKMRKLVAADIVLPRNQVQILQAQSSLETNLSIAIATGHTRFPFCDGDLDNTLGIIHIKDIFRARGVEGANGIDLDALKRPFLRLCEQEPLERAFKKLLVHKTHMAIVEDEFGGAVGILTVETLLEQLVGPIQDEFDSEEAPLRVLHNGHCRVSGLMPLHDLEVFLGFDIEDNDVSTVSGLVTAHVGGLPQKGECFKIGKLKITIEDVDDTRIKMVTLELVEQDSLHGNYEDAR